MAVYAYRYLVQLCTSLLRLLGPMNVVYKDVLNTVILLMEVHLSTLYSVLIITVYSVCSENKLMATARTSSRICMKCAWNK